MEATYPLALALAYMPTPSFASRHRSALLARGVNILEDFPFG